MNKNKIREVSFVLFLILVILFALSPRNTPYVIKNRDMVIEVDKITKEPYINVYVNNQKLFVISPWQSLLKYNGVEKLIYSPSGKKSWFSGEDNKKINVEMNKLIIEYSNKTKDPSFVREVYSLEGSLITYEIDGNFSRPEKIEEHSLGLVNKKNWPEKFDKLVLQNGRIINLNDRKGFINLDRIKIPQNTRDYISLESDNYSADIFGSFNKIYTDSNSLIYLTRVYGLYNKTKKIFIKIDEKKDDEDYFFEIATSRKNTDGIHIFNENREIFYISPWELIFNIDGKWKRVLSEDTKKEHNESWLDYKNARKDIIISELTEDNKNKGYEMIVSWTNKDDLSIKAGVSVKVYKNKRFIEIFPFYHKQDESKTIKPIACGIKFFENYKYIIFIYEDNKTKVDSVKKDQYKKIEECENNKCKIIKEIKFVKQINSSEKNLKLIGNIGKIEEFFKYDILRIYDNKGPSKISF